MSDHIKEEIANMRRALDQAFLEDTETKYQRIKQIKTDVTLALKRGLPVEITPEMRKLEIADEIAEILAKAEIAARYKRLYADDDDEEEISFEPNRPVFF